MPTALDRVQCLMQPELYAQLKTLAKHNKRTLSAMCAELVAHAIKTPTYQQQLDVAEEVVAPKPDPRMATPQAQFRSEMVKAAMDGAALNDKKMVKLIKAMELLEMMEQDKD